SLWQQQPDQALALLQDVNACPLDLRDFTWHLYHRLCQRERYRLASDSGWNGLVSGDGKVLALARPSQEGDVNPTVVRLYDPASGQERSRIRLAARPLTTTARLSPDGKLLAWAVTATSVTLWDTTTGEERGQTE